MEFEFSSSNDGEEQVDQLLDSFRNIESRTNILELINPMPKLRALTTRCENDKMNPYELSKINDDLIEWLCKRLSSTCTYGGAQSGRVTH
ncbi:unnamed protein product [Rotaria sordida]|uniref:Uncharacterized protein n=1 Tax=Rotaria sordida TaxID=392033 RepID=A0A820EA55_9BILA|nr:unnamed protein product [Rotaria sordida]